MWRSNGTSSIIVSRNIYHVIYVYIVKGTIGRIELDIGIKDSAKAIDIKDSAKATIRRIE